jgi:AcrR family transcriptional regulator
VTPHPEYGVETPVVKRLRADARRNRDRLLAVADEVFATQGAGASTDDIARAAGVGIGTLFRHFPTKEALLAAVFEARLRHLAEQARHLSATQDPGTSFAIFFRQVISEARTRLTLVDALALEGIDISLPAGDAKQDFNAALGQLLGRAQQAGAVRSDVRLSEVVALIVGTSRAVQHTGTDRQAEARLVEVVLDGLGALPKTSGHVKSGRPRR